MRKDILLSLLAVGAIPSVALANIDVTEMSELNEQANWVNNGLGSVTKLDDGLFVITGASAGNLTCTIAAAKLPAAVYEIKTAGEKTVNVKLSVNGKEITDKDNVFTHDGKSDIVVKLEGAEPTDWTIEKIEIAIKCDFAAAKAALEALKGGPDNDVTLDTPLAEITGKDQGEGHNYKTDCGDPVALQKKIDDVKAALEKLTEANEKGDLKTAIEIYEEFGLDQDPAEYSKTVKALLEEIAGFNKKVKENNAKSANYEANQAQKAEVEAAIKAAEKAVGALDWTKDFVEEETKALVDDEEVGFKALCEQIRESLKALDGDEENLTDEETAAAAIDKVNDLKDMIIAAYNADKADAEAYAAIGDCITAIEEAYTDDLHQIMGLTGQFGTDKGAALTKIKEDAIAKLKEIEKVGAAEADPKGIKDKAIAEMNELVEAALAQKEASDKAYAEQDAELKALVEDFAKVKEEVENLPSDEIYPDGHKSALMDKCEEIEEWLDAAREFIDGNKEEYACADDVLNPALVEADIEDIKAQLAAAAPAIEAWVANNTELSTLLAQLQAARQTCKDEDAKSGYAITEKFDVSYEAIKKDIETAKANNDANLKNGKNEGDEGYLPVDKDYIKKGIKEYQSKAVETTKAFSTKIAAYNDLMADCTKVEDFAKKEPLEGSEFKADEYLAQLADVKADVEGIKGAMDKAYKELKADELYEAIHKINVGSLAQDIDAIYQAMVKDFVECNMKAVEALVKGYNDDFAAHADDPLYKDEINKEDKDKSKYVTYGPGLEKLTALMDKLAADVDATATAVEKADDAEGYLAANDEVEALYKKISDEVEALKAKCLENVKNYKAYLGGAAYKDYDGMDEYIKKNSRTPATEAWKETEEYKDIVATREALDKAAKDLYDKNECPAGFKADEKSDLRKRVNAFKKLVKANNDNYTAQLGWAEDAMSKVGAAIDKVENAGYDESLKFNINGKEMTINDVLDRLAEIQKEISGVNTNVYDAHAALNCPKDNQYKDLTAEIEALLQAVASDYYRAVVDYNNAIMEAALGGIDKELDDAYKAYVKLYNSFVEKDAEFEQYNIYIDELVSEIAEEYGHAKIQYYYELLRTLNEKCQEVLGNAEPALSEDGTVEGKVTLLKEADFAGIKAEIEAALAEVAALDKGLVKTVDGIANNYLNGKFSTVYEYVQEEQELMGIAGMAEEDIIEACEDAMLHITLANAYLDSDLLDGGDDNPTAGNYGDILLGGDPEKRDEAIAKYFINMRACLEELALVDINTAAILTDFWNGLYADAQTKLADYEARYNEAAKGALDEALEEAEMKLATAKNTIAQLNEYAQNWIQRGIAGPMANAFGVGYTDTTTDEFGTNQVIVPALVPALKDAVDLAEEAAIDAENAKADNQYNIDKLAELKDELADIEKKIKEMHSTIGALNIDFEDIQGEIDDADEAFGELKSYLVDENGNDTKYAGKVAGAFETTKGWVEDAIDAAYAKAYELEKARVNQILTDVEEDFNNKYANGELTKEEYDALDEVIAAQREALKAAKTLEDLVAIENALVETGLGNIKTNVNEEAVSNARAALDAKADEVKAAYDKFMAEYPELEADAKTIGYDLAKYDDRDKIGAELEDLVAAYSTDNSVQTSVKYYTGALETLAKRVNALLDELGKDQIKVAAEIEKRAVSDAAYAENVAAFEKLDGYFEQAKFLVGQYEKLVTDYSAVVAEIEGKISSKKDANEQAKAENACTVINLDDIELSIKHYLAAATLEETTNWISAARDAYYDALKAVNDGNHANQAELEEILESYAEEFSSYVEPTSDPEEAALVIDMCREFIDITEGIIAAAQMNAYTPGDYDGDGKVTSIDFVSLIDIILGNEEMPEEGTPGFAALDLNGDGVIGIGDAVKMLRIINRLDEDPSSVAKAPARYTAVDCQANIANGAFNLSNNIAVASALIDLKDVTADDVTLGARAAGMQMMTGTLADGTLRVLLIGENNETLAGNDGAILNITGNASIVKAVVSDIMGRETVVADNTSATGIDMITGAIKNVGEKIYNLGGQMMNGIKKGINIIRNNEGSSSKVLNK